MKKLSKFLIVVDSADHSGKTKLCQHLIEKYRFNYYHCGVQSDIKAYHGDVLDLVFEDADRYNNNWVIDRLHLSEEVYGNIFRNGAVYDWKELNNHMIEEAKKDGIKYVLITCLPPKQIVVEGHAARNADGNEMFSTVDKVYDAYEKIYTESKDDLQMYKYDFTDDPNYEKLDQYLESL